MTGSEVSEKLLRRFGQGTRPTIRRALYERLAQIVDEHGELAVQIIATVVEDSRTKRKPDHYFAYVVMRRLQDRGLLSCPARQFEVGLG